MASPKNSNELFEKQILLLARKIGLIQAELQRIPVLDIEGRAKKHVEMKRANMQIERMREWRISTTQRNGPHTARRPKSTPVKLRLVRTRRVV